MNRRVVLSALSVAALASGLLAVPASAGTSAFECAQGQACFFETTSFSGKVVQYDDVPAECTRLPFAPGALFNWSDKDVLLYRTADCSGTASVEPANNFHSYPSTAFLSFRAG